MTKLRGYSDRSDTTTHVYEVQHFLDRDGRRTGIVHPTWLSPGSDLTQYRYDAAGRLGEARGPLSSMLVEFEYNDDGTLAVKTFNAGMSADSIEYNSSKRIDSRKVSVQGTSLMSFGANYDDMGRVTSAGGSTFTYNGLGHLTSSSFSESFVYDEQEFVVNGLGQADTVYTDGIVGTMPMSPTGIEHKTFLD